MGGRKRLLDYDIPIYRKPDPELPPPFICAACERVIVSDVWQVLRGDVDKPPLCNSCVSRGSERIGAMWGATRGDKKMMTRFRAMIAFLEWEVMNGQYRKR